MLSGIGNKSSALSLVLPKQTLWNKHGTLGCLPFFFYNRNYTILPIARYDFRHTSFEAAAIEYTTAIESLQKILQHIKVYGDEAGNLPDAAAGGDGDGRGRLAPLFWSRAAAHIMIGRYRSAVKDCALALEAAGDWEQVGGRRSVPLIPLLLLWHFGGGRLGCVVRCCCAFEGSSITILLSVGGC